MIPVHIISGFLGSGKTTLLLDQLKTRHPQEKSAVIVNDFGQARFDATLLGEKAFIKDIPGGCLCCTAPENLAPSLLALLEEAQPDRIFIEATGLAHPADLFDTLSRQIPEGRIELCPVITLIDPNQLQRENLPSEFEAQLKGADIWIANRLDQSTPEALESLRERAKNHYPPLLHYAETTRSQVDASLFDLRSQKKRPSPHHHHAHGEKWVAISQEWPAHTIFDMAQLRSVLESAQVERLKGIFHTDIGWYQMEIAGGVVERSSTPFRSINRVDIIDQKGANGAKDLSQALETCRWTPPSATEIPSLLITFNGQKHSLNRDDILALDGQVEDISAHIPKRAGTGVYLANILERIPEIQGQNTFIVIAADGMTTEAVPVAEVGQAILAHSLDEAPLPLKKGGPFRILIPPGAGKSACANVKKVVRIVIE